MATKREKAAKLMVYTDLTQKEIAKKINTSENTISRWKKKEDFQKLLKENEVSYMKDLIAPAMRGLKDLIDADSEFVKLEAIKTILDRAGYESIDDRMKEIEIEHAKAKLEKTKTEIGLMKGISEEIEDLDDIDGVIYGQDKD